MYHSIDYKIIAQETMHIIDLGGYVLNEQRVHLKLSEEEMKEVIVYSPKRITETKEMIGEAWKMASNEHYCKIKVVNCDSFEAAHSDQKALERKTLVMNFANAIYCGGGFLNGANAQEEALCRSSSLYASISSESAKKMYEYNYMYQNPFDSDYMLISPNVEVFRNSSGELCESFLTSVVTIPALNLKGRASKLEPYKISDVMKNRICNMFVVAYSLGFKRLVLGAWGCGAFGHDAKDVASYFKEVLEQNQHWKMFFEITFAVMDDSREQYNFKSFLEVFGSSFVYGNQKEAEKIKIEDLKDKEDNVKGYFRMNYFPPTVNTHSKSLKKGSDLSIVAGCMKDGRPFLTELYHCEEMDTLEFIAILPTKGLRVNEITRTMDDSMVVERNQQPVMKAALLTDLKVSKLDAICDSMAAEELCNLLEEHQLITIIDETFAFDYYISFDLADEKVVVCIVTLQEGNRKFCECNIFSIGII